MGTLGGEGDKTDVVIENISLLTGFIDDCLTIIIVTEHSGIY
jgi:hypothetical protein